MYIIVNSGYNTITIYSKHKQTAVKVRLNAFAQREIYRDFNCVTFAFEVQSILLLYCANIKHVYTYII